MRALLPRRGGPRTQPAMRILSAAAVLLVFAPNSCGRAGAASSGWVETEGASLRLVTAGTPETDGKLRGALEILLKPGWKTYWRDPGDAGVPPTIDVSASTNVTGAELEFPAPRRFDDGYAVWAGYSRPVSLPVVFTLADPSTAPLIDAKVFLGVCEKICVPAQAELDLDPANGAGSAEDETTVRDAFAALPKPAGPGFEVSAAALSGDLLAVSADIPGDKTAAELFVAGEAGYALGVPKRVVADGRLRFEVPLLDRPAISAASLPYTLVTPDGAVSGRIDLP